MSDPFGDSSGFSDCESSMSETCDMSSSIREEIFRLCDDCDNGCSKSDYSSSSCHPCKPGKRRHCSENFIFTSIVTPLSSLTPLYSNECGCVEFIMRRKNKVVTLQWEPFSGVLTTSGIAYLSVPQTIANLPPYPIYIPIYIQYKDIYRQTFVLIDPFDVKDVNIKFYLNTNGTSLNINANDNVTVLGGAVSWVVE